MFEKDIISPTQYLSKDLGISTHELFIRREDKIHSIISGNKYRKLKYNLIEARNVGVDCLVTYGGAYSNHIAAVAQLGLEFGIPTIGVIRGEELEFKPINNTLKRAQNCGMQFKFVPRNWYREKDSIQNREEIKKLFPNCYIIPEGGSNHLAVKGCFEILTDEDEMYDLVATAVGTGGTLAGLASNNFSSQNYRGYSVLKGTFQKKLVSNYVSLNQVTITDAYSFGGYAKIDETLIRFINDFYEKTNIILDPVYTGKMMFGILNDIASNQIPKNTCILAIHTGGLQGIKGMNALLQKKGMPTLIEP